MIHPMDLLKTWLEEEQSIGTQYTKHAVLSTQGLNGQAHGRVVAIREITEDWIVFFTQKRTRKVEEIKVNSNVTLTFWFERNAREIIIEGEAAFLSETQNEHYWNNYPKYAQVRFCSYAATSGLPIKNKQVLENKRIEIEKSSQNKLLPLSLDYCGISVKPKRFVFYTYRLDELSDVWEYQIDETGLTKRRLSP